MTDKTKWIISGGGALLGGFVGIKICDWVGNAVTETSRLIKSDSMAYQLDITFYIIAFIALAVAGYFATRFIIFLSGS